MRGLALLGLIGAIAACDSSEPVSKVGTMSAALVPPLIEEEDIVTPADFEPVAAKSISKASYKTELIVLAFEIERK